MTTRFEKDVQGVALYLEFRKVGATCQIIITPDALQETGEPSFAQFFRRVISNGATKRKWQAYTLKPRRTLRSNLQAGTNVHEYMNEEVITDGQERLLQLSDYLNSLATRGYKLVKDTPIYIEVTKADMTAIRQGDLPAKMWTRVKSSRAALDFPIEIIDSTSTSTVASAEEPAF